MPDIFDFAPARRQFAVVGNPVAHSLSPRIHQAFAQQFGIALEYQRIQVDVGGFAPAVSHFFARAGAGLNITIPFKTAAYKLCAETGEVRDRARWAEAVNTLQYTSDGKICGDNTDGVGLRRDLENNLGWEIAGRRILLLGAGGAARGILAPLLQRAPAELIIANRTAATARQLAEKFSTAQLQVRGCGYERLGEFTAASPNFDLVLNATATSLQQQLPPIEPACIRGAMVYDLAYADAPTRFVQWARSNAARAATDGLGMLVEQAAEAFYLWHQQRADTAAVLAALRKS